MMPEADPLAGHSIRVMLASAVLRDMALQDLADGSHLLVAATAWIIEDRPNTDTLIAAVNAPDLNPHLWDAMPDDLVAALTRAAHARRADMEKPTNG